MEERILMAHGNGGERMNDLIGNLITEILGKESIQLDDSAVLEFAGGKLVFTTDTYTITPLFFEGGDIGKLAVNGTVNDLSVMGARPMFLSCGFVLEEGLNVDTLKRILQSMRQAAIRANLR